MFSKTHFANIIFVTAVVLCSACSHPQRGAERMHLEQGGVEAITFPAELRAGYAKYSAKTTKFCAEPFPDVALESVETISGNLKAQIPSGPGIDAGAQVELATKVVQLAGRTQVVLLARELLYRACEMQMNGALQDSQQAVEIYKEVLTLIRLLGKAEYLEALDPITRQTGKDNADEILGKVLKSMGDQEED